MTRISFFFLLVFSSLVTVSLHAERISIDSGWEFRQARLDNWHPAVVPGTVHTDLMRCGLIADPFDALNERTVQWVDKEDWEYRTTFDADLSNSSAFQLVFHGLDTYADVFLGDSLILQADNMFRTWKVDVTTLLMPTDNVLRILFHSPIRHDLDKWNALPLKYEAGNDQSENGGIFDRRLSVFARKAGYHYGWDWGPRLVTSGIWRPVELESIPTAPDGMGIGIDDIFTRQQTTAKLSRLTETVMLKALKEGPATIRITDKSTGKMLASRHVMLQAGENEVTLQFQIKNPRLWWCNGLGDPHLYTFTTEVLHEAYRVSRDQRIGLRSLRLLNAPDEVGREFCFELNGHRVFMKGANYIPCDNFLPRVNDSIYRETIRSATDVNMNMLRVWGGGTYEDDRFYDLCDEHGILVWQDFMFACSLYPSSGALLDNMRAEARDNIIRLRNHPCIALWCGNNECQDALYGWGWRKAYLRQDSAFAERVQREFEDLYYVALPELVSQYDPDITYWPSSPFADYRITSKTTSGDFHYWGVWHGGEPVSNYNTHRARFYSEYGMQSFPEFESVKAFCPDPAQWDIHSDVMMSHQRGGSFANSRIESYLESEYVKPDDFAELLYVGQLMQGDAMKTAVEAHRRDKGYCWGTLLWQINDCWPVASWSTRDWYGRWKAAHYMMRHAMDDVLVSPIRKDNRLDVYLVNDRLQTLRGTLTVELRTMTGEVVSSATKRCIASANSSTCAFSADVTALLNGHAPADVIVTADFVADRTYTATYCMEKPRDMHFPCADVRTEVQRDADGTTWIALSADVFVRGIFLSLPGRINPFADNYIDLRPGQTVRVKVNGNIPPQEISSRLQLIHLMDIGK